MENVETLFLWDEQAKPSSFWTCAKKVKLCSKKAFPMPKIELPWWRERVQQQIQPQTFFYIHWIDILPLSFKKYDICELLEVLIKVRQCRRQRMLRFTKRSTFFPLLSLDNLHWDTPFIECGSICRSIKYMSNSGKIDYNNVINWKK